MLEKACGKCLNMSHSMLLFLLVLLCSTTAWAGEKCCSEIPGLCFNEDSPFDLLPLPECPDEIHVTMKVFTRANRESGQAITRSTIPGSWQAGRRTHLVVHGWLGSKDNTWMDDMKNAALDRRDYNFVIVGWDEGSQQIWYPKSASDTRSVGAHIAAVFDNLVRNGGAQPAEFYCTGHSLGSHVCGHAGAYSQSLFGFTIGRITGLDPAGPFFEGRSWEVGLNPNCASFVDIMHTNGGPGLILNLGTMKRLGHVDFYPNEGEVQPGCMRDPFDLDRVMEGKTLNEESDMFIDTTPECSHAIALEYYFESIQQPCFLARYLCTDQHDLPGSCKEFVDPIQAMGFDADAEEYLRSGIFYLETHKFKPFCMS